jgi:hypothetical protein
LRVFHLRLASLPLPLFLKRPSVALTCLYKVDPPSAPVAAGPNSLQRRKMLAPPCTRSSFLDYLLLAVGRGTTSAGAHSYKGLVVLLPAVGRGATRALRHCCRRFGVVLQRLGDAATGGGVWCYKGLAGRLSTFRSGATSA